MSKTITIKKTTIWNFILGFILGFSILFGIEHFGSFSYMVDYGNIEIDNHSWTQQVPGNTKIAYIEYTSYFGNKIKTSGNGFTIYDLNVHDSDFFKYQNKSYYYTQAMIMDYKYGLIFSIIIFLIALFFSNFKIKLQ